VFISLLHQTLDVFIIDAVIYLLTFTPGSHKPQVTQNAQLVRGGAWAKPALGSKIIDVRLPAKQDSKQV
jgi:hypothetical protein